MNNVRILTISDPHGCYDKLVELLEKVKYNSNEDKLILLGDYVDRGKDSMKTLLLVGDLVDNGAIALEGNHDNMFKQLIKDDCLFQALTSEYYIELGTSITVKDYYKLDLKSKQRIENILDKLIPYYTYDNYIFVHGGVNVNIPLEDNEPQQLMWLREEFYNNKAYVDKKIIFGHTPTCLLCNDPYKRTIWRDTKFNDKICIDCACVYGGNLACLDLTNNIEYYV